MPVNIVNGSFEEAGTNAGDALGWVTGAQSGYERYAVFGTIDPLLDAESFEAEWLSNEDFIFFFDPLVDIVAPPFDTTIGAGEGFEDFEEGWSDNHGYAYEMGSIDAALFGTGFEDVDDMESEWSSNESFSFVMGSTTAALFGTGLDDEDDFENEWRSNESYDFTMGSVTAALFDAAAEAVEDFEESIAAIVVVPDPSTSKLGAAAHGFVNTDRVTFESDGVMPIGLSDSVAYYVVNKTTNDFQVSLSSGGAAVSFFTGANGEVRALRDTARFWVSFLS